MVPDTQPAAFDHEGPEALAACRVDNPIEIHALLRQLRDTGTPVVLSAPDGSTVATAVWSVDPDRQRLTLTADDSNALLHTLINADEVATVAYLDAVKLQFDLHDLLLVRGSTSAMLQAGWPEVLYRFQRRSAYRVRTIERYSPTARVRHPGAPDTQLAMRVLDVSIGGCALLVPADLPALEPGLILQGMQVELDADTRFVATVRIQYLTPISTNASSLRAGCEWRGLSRESERSLQRYIDHTQKRRRLLSMG